MITPSRSRAKMTMFLHIIVLIMIIAALAVSGIKLLTAPKRQASTSSTGGRSGTIALSMGAKSLMFLLYQLLTSHVAKFKRWASPKANMILNIIDIVSWAAVVYLGIAANLKTCTGTSCLLSWIVIALGGCLSLLSVVTSYIAIGDWKYYKANGVLPSEVPLEELSDTEAKPYARGGR